MSLSSRNLTKKNQRFDLAQNSGWFQEPCAPHMAQGSLSGLGLFLAAQVCAWIPNRCQALGICVEHPFAVGLFRWATSASAQNFVLMVGDYFHQLKCDLFGRVFANVYDRGISHLSHLQ
jgi:hypothetical protein